MRYCSYLGTYDPAGKEHINSRFIRDFEFHIFVVWQQKNAT
jgi:hypothetical protein